MVREIEFDGSEMGIRKIILGERDPLFASPGNHDNPRFWLESESLYHYEGLEEECNVPEGFTENVWYVYDFGADDGPETLIYDADELCQANFRGFALVLGRLKDGTFSDVCISADELLKNISWNVPQKRHALPSRE